MRRWITALGPRTAAVAAAVALLAVVGLATGILDAPSLLITLGGALAVAAVTFSPARIVQACHHLRDALGDEADCEALVESMKRLARVHRMEGMRALERAAAGDTDPFVRDAVALGVEADDLDVLNDQLVAEGRRHTGDIEAARQVVAALGKLFPAFGLIGTLLGLTSLLAHLDGGTLATLGPALGIAVQTTLYGALLANVVVLPLATRLQAHATRRARRLQMVIDGTLLVVRRAYPSQVERVLRAHAGSRAAERPRPVSLRVADRAA